MTTSKRCPTCGSFNTSAVDNNGFDDGFEDEPASRFCEECDTEFASDSEVSDENVYNDDMDGDHESALASAGFGTDEDYGCFNEPDMDF